MYGTSLETLFSAIINDDFEAKLGVRCILLKSFVFDSQNGTDRYTMALTACAIQFLLRTWLITEKYYSAIQVNLFEGWSSVYCMIFRDI